MMTPHCAAALDTRIWHLMDRLMDDPSLPKRHRHVAGYSLEKSKISSLTISVVVAIDVETEGQFTEHNEASFEE